MSASATVAAARRSRSSRFRVTTGDARFPDPLNRVPVTTTSSSAVTASALARTSPRRKKMTPGRPCDQTIPDPASSRSSASRGANRPTSPGVVRPATKSPAKRICWSAWVAKRFSPSRSEPAGMVNWRASWAQAVALMDTAQATIALQDNRLKRLIFRAPLDATRRRRGGDRGPGRPRSLDGFIFRVPTIGSSRSARPTAPDRKRPRPLRQRRHDPPS